MNGNNMRSLKMITEATGDLRKSKLRPIKASKLQESSNSQPVYALKFFQGPSFDLGQVVGYV